MSSALERYRTLQVERQAAQGILDEAVARLSEQQEILASLDKVQRFFSLLADERRSLLETRVGSLVDYGIKTIFGSRYAFRVRSELAGKFIKTRFYIVEQGKELDILNAAGGGIADVVSFLLRVVMLMLTSPAQQRVIVLDEPFKHVSDGYMGKVVDLLTELSSELELQIIMVTHRPELEQAATTLFRVSKTDGLSHLV